MREGGKPAAPVRWKLEPRPSLGKWTTGSRGAASQMWKAGGWFWKRDVGTGSAAVCGGNIIWTCARASQTTDGKHSEALLKESAVPLASWVRLAGWLARTRRCSHGRRSLNV